MSSNVVVKKSYDFALQIILIYKQLKARSEFDIAKQLLRSGTSIGANIQEAQSAQSKKDFIHKFHIALKEARETRYWLSLIVDSQLINKSECVKIRACIDELIKIISKILITTKSRQ